MATLSSTTPQAEHFIPGKDASLESSIATMQAGLHKLGFTLEERSWLNPVAGVWSVHIRDSECPLLFTNGKGASEAAARASALGEFFERLSCNYFWNHYYLGQQQAAADSVHYPQEKWFPLGTSDAWPSGLLTPELHELYNPDSSIPASALVDMNSGNAERGICAIPYTRQSDEAEVFFPVNIISNLYVSNGMSAGNSPAEARCQALAEIFERHIKFRIIREAICLPDVPEAVIARYPHIAAGIAELRAAGFGILVKDASLGGQYPVMNVTLLHPEDQGCFSSFGAHPRFEIALERALTELLQGRGLNALTGFPPPGFDEDEIADTPNIEIHFVDSSGILHWKFFGDTPDFPFCDWNFSDSTASDYAWLLQTLHEAGHEVYIADFTHAGMYACRILVPGISEIYPFEELEWENNSIANTFRPPLSQLQDLDDEACVELLEALEDNDVAEQRLVAGLIGLAADPGSAWAELRVGELKALLALAIGDDDATLEACAWIASFGEIPPARQRVYQCISHIIKLDEPAPYEAALVALFGEETVVLADRLLAGELRFFGLSNLGANMEGSTLHSKLLAAYRKVWHSAN